MNRDQRAELRATACEGTTESSKARSAAERIANDGHLAGDAVRSMRALSMKSTSGIVTLNFNSVIRDTLDVMQSELLRHDVSLETRACRRTRIHPG